MTIVSDLRLDAPLGTPLDSLQAAIKSAGIAPYLLSMIGPLPGLAASSISLPDGTVVPVAGAGDPERVYIALRSATAADLPPGLTPPAPWVISDRAASVAVLGLWAGEVWL